VDLDFSPALYPPGGERLGKNPTETSRRPSLDYARSSLTELRGQLCVARMRDDEPNTPGVLELWMSKSAMQPRWDRQCAIPVANTGGHSTLFRWGT
jgi:hypothetical protein